MRFTIKRAYLEQLLDKATTVNVTGAVKEDLKGFLVKLDGKLLKVVRTDENLAVLAQTALVTVQNPEPPHQIVVNASKFYNLVKRATCDEIQIETKEGMDCLIQAGSYKGTWVGAGRPGEFPQLTEPSGKNAVSIDAKKFVELLERVRYAAAQESVQVNLKQLVFEDGECWASDGMLYQKVNTGFPKSVKFTLPTSAMDIAKFIRLSSTETIEFEATDNYYFFKIGEDRFVCRNPHSKNAAALGVLAHLNPGKQGKFVVETLQLLDVVKRISITSERSSNRIYLELRPGVLVVSGQDEDMNLGEESLRINYSGSPNAKKKFSVHWEFLLEALQAVKDKTVEVRVDAQHVILNTEDGTGVVPMLAE